MTTLSDATIDELLDELKTRPTVYYKVENIFYDPVLHNNLGHIHIYDIRESAESYEKNDDD